MQIADNACMDMDRWMDNRSGPHWLLLFALEGTNELDAMMLLTLR
jgi:hypothetical protein